MLSEIVDVIWRLASAYSRQLCLRQAGFGEISEIGWTGRVNLSGWLEFIDRDLNLGRDHPSQY